MSDAPNESPATELTRSPANELILTPEFPAGWYFETAVFNVPAPYAQADFTSTIASAFSYIQGLDMTTPVNVWINNISGNVNYWTNYSNSGLNPPTNAGGNYPPLYWEFANYPSAPESLFPFWSSTDPPVLTYADPVSTNPKGIFAGIQIQGATIGSPGAQVQITRWRLRGFAASTLSSCLIHADGLVSTGATPNTLAFIYATMDGPNNVLESVSTLSPIGTNSHGNIYAVDGVTTISPLTVPSSGSFGFWRGQFVYTEGFDGTAPPSSTDGTVTVLTNPSNTSCVHNSTSATFSCSGSVAAGHGYSAAYSWAFSPDSGVTWFAVDPTAGPGSGTYTRTGQRSSTLTFTPTTTASNGWLFKCQIYDVAGFKTTTSATLTVT